MTLVVFHISIIHLLEFIVVVTLQPFWLYFIQRFTSLITCISVEAEKNLVISVIKAEGQNLIGFYFIALMLITRK